MYHGSQRAGKGISLRGQITIPITRYRAAIEDKRVLSAAPQDDAVTVSGLYHSLPWLDVLCKIFRNEELRIVPTLRISLKLRNTHVKDVLERYLASISIPQNGDFTQQGINFGHCPSDSAGAQHNYRHT